MLACGAGHALATTTDMSKEADYGVIAPDCGEKTHSGGNEYGSRT